MPLFVYSKDADSLRASRRVYEYFDEGVWHQLDVGYDGLPVEVELKGGETYTIEASLGEFRVANVPIDSIVRVHLSPMIVSSKFRLIDFLDEDQRRRYADWKNKR